MLLLLPLLLFWFDITIYQWLESPHMYALTAGYSFLLLRLPPAYAALGTALLLSGLESFLAYGRYGANFLLLLPITLLGLSMRRHIATSPWVLGAFAAITLLLQVYCLPWLLRTI